MKAAITRGILTVLALTSISWARTKVEVEDEEARGRKFADIIFGPTNLKSSQPRGRKFQNIILGPTTPIFGPTTPILGTTTPILGPTNLGSSQAEVHKFLEHGNDFLIAVLNVSNYELLCDYYNKVMTVAVHPVHVANQVLEDSEGSVY